MSPTHFKTNQGLFWRFKVSIFSLSFPPLPFPSPFPRPFLYQHSNGDGRVPVRSNGIGCTQFDWPLPCPLSLAQFPLFSQTLPNSLHFHSLIPNLISPLQSDHCLPKWRRRGDEWPAEWPSGGEGPCASAESGAQGCGPEFCKRSKNHLF